MRVVRLRDLHPVDSLMEPGVELCVSLYVFKTSSADLYAGIGIEIIFVDECAGRRGQCVGLRLLASRHSGWAALHVMSIRLSRSGGNTGSGIITTHTHACRSRRRDRACRNVRWFYRWQRRTGRSFYRARGCLCACATHGAGRSPHEKPSHAPDS